MYMGKIRYDVVIISLITGGMVALSLFCNVKKEGFRTNQHMSIYPSSSMSNGVPGRVQGEVYNQNTSCENHHSSLSKNTVGRTAPLQNGELAMFADNTMSPECCPSSYSGSGGCVCETEQQMKYLSSRGGNRNTMDSF
jgi:hypothetical protein